MIDRSSVFDSIDLAFYLYLIDSGMPQKYFFPKPLYLYLLTKIEMIDRTSVLDSIDLAFYLINRECLDNLSNHSLFVFINKNRNVGQNQLT